MTGLGDSYAVQRLHTMEAFWQHTSEKCVRNNVQNRTCEKMCVKNCEKKARMCEKFYKWLENREK